MQGFKGLLQRKFCTWSTKNELKVHMIKVKETPVCVFKCMQNQHRMCLKEVYDCCYIQESHISSYRCMQVTGRGNQITTKH